MVEMENKLTHGLEKHKEVDLQEVDHQMVDLEEVRANYLVD